MGWDDRQINGKVVRWFIYLVVYFISVIRVIHSII